MIQFGGACARHRSVLVDFVDHAEIGPATASALAHLDQCSRCTADLEVIVQTITALRRIGDEAGRVEPAVDAWPRLRNRLTRWRPAQWKIMPAGGSFSMPIAELTPSYICVPTPSGKSVLLIATAICRLLR